MDKIPFRYDAKAIDRDVDIISVLNRYTNSRIKGKMCTCPNPAHHDTHPSASIKNNKVTCWSACGKQSWGPISLVMMTQGLEFMDACKFLIEEYGLNLEYYSNIRDIEREKEILKKGKKEDTIPFEMSELTYIGLKPDMKKTLYTEYYTEKKQEIVEHVNTTRDGEPILDARGKPRTWKEHRMVDVSHGETMENPSLKEMWYKNEKGDREMICDLVIDKCNEKADRLQNLINAYREDGKYYLDKYGETGLNQGKAYLEKYVNGRDFGVYATTQMMAYCAYRDARYRITELTEEMYKVGEIYGKATEWLARLTITDRKREIWKSHERK